MTNEKVVNKFIVFEGVDGAGKSTVANALKERLIELGHETLHCGSSVSENIYSPISAFIKEQILHGEVEYDEITQAVLFAAMFNDLLTRHIHPALKRGEFVICERFVLSTEIYQKTRGIAKVITNYLESVAPEMVMFVLDVPPQITKNRINATGGPDRLESVSDTVLSNRRHLYRKHVDTNSDCYLVDGTLPVDVIVDHVLKIMGVE